MSEPIKFYFGIFIVAVVLVGILYSVWSEDE